MEVPFMHSYHSSSSHYDDDDIMSNNSYNMPLSNTSGSTITIEPTLSGCSSTAPRNRVRDMVKLFEESSGSATTTPVSRAESTMFISPKPYYTATTHGTSNNYSGSQASVKQYVSQFQQADEQVKVNERSRRNNIGVGRCVVGGKQYGAQYQENEEQVKLAEKGQRSVASGCAFSAVNSASQTSMKPLQQFQVGDAPTKITERCSRCNVLYRCEDIHYCLGKPGYAGSEQNRMPRNECSKSSGVSLGANNSSVYSGFAENRNNDMLRSPSKLLSESKIRESRQNPTGLYETVDGIPASLAYDSKTTIFRTQDGVRIIVDISIDGMSNLSAADVVGSRIETEMPHSRILTEFQQKTAMIMAGDESRL